MRKPGKLWVEIVSYTEFLAKNAGAGAGLGSPLLPVPPFTVKCLGLGFSDSHFVDSHLRTEEVILMMMISNKHKN